MELEFDKEIDAILRKARKSEDVAEVKTTHLDADVIAAFAENALPQKVKLLYSEHFADCGRCRKLLAQSVAWPRAETARKAVAVAPGISIPWYSKLFRTPNLALAMGGLVLVFGGILALLLINRNSSYRDSTVSQATSDESRPSIADQAPAQQAQTANSNAAVSNTAAAANIAADPQPATEPRMENERAVKPGVRGPAETPGPTGDLTTAGTGSSAGAPVDQPKPVGSAPPPVMASRPPEAEERKDDADKTKEERSRDAKQQEDRVARESPADSAKAVSGPKRAAGPRQNAQTNSIDLRSMSQLPLNGRSIEPIKTAGGKKFELRDGAWYDTAYHGQATRDVRRNSSAYKGLDAGLRSIAASIGGVVVVVWKGSAYRIQ